MCPHGVGVCGLWPVTYFLGVGCQWVVCEWFVVVSVFVCWAFSDILSRFWSMASSLMDLETTMKFRCSDVHPVSLGFLRCPWNFGIVCVSWFLCFLGSLVWRLRCVWIRGGTMVFPHCGGLAIPSGFLGSVSLLLLVVLLVGFGLLCMILPSHPVGRVVFSVLSVIRLSPQLSYGELPVDWWEDPSFWYRCGHPSFPCRVLFLLSPHGWLWSYRCRIDSEPTDVSRYCVLSLQFITVSSSFLNFQKLWDLFRLTFLFIITDKTLKGGRQRCRFVVYFEVIKRELSRRLTWVSVWWKDKS
jgi:hypothetical protein